MYRHLYDDFDVAAFANTFKTCILYIMVISLAILIVLGIILLPLEWLGIYKLGN